jgi:hypothetical protein
LPLLLRILINPSLLVLLGLRLKNGQLIMPTLPDITHHPLLERFRRGNDGFDLICPDHETPFLADESGELMFPSSGEV